MKKNIVLVAFISLLCAFFTNDLMAQKEKKDSKTTTVYFYVEEMECKNCQATVEKNIPFEKGVTDLKCDLPSKMVAVTYRADKTDSKKLAVAFEKIKMPAKEVPVAAEPKKK